MEASPEVVDYTIGSNVNGSYFLAYFSDGKSWLTSAMAKAGLSESQPPQLRFKLVGVKVMLGGGGKSMASQWRQLASKSCPSFC